MADAQGHTNDHRSQKGRMWTYLILATGLVVVAVIANLVISNPELATKGVDAIAGLPAWAFAAITGLIGLLLFFVGLKIEADWPERTGAVLVGGSIAGGEFLLGWQNFEFGGLKVIPYLIPVVVCLGLMMYANARSK